jgi:threonine/homoserine/homoserine lactone efflux protein
LGVTTNVINLPINLLIVYGSPGVTGALRRNSQVSGWLQRAMGALFVTLGLRLAIERT